MTHESSIGLSAELRTDHINLLKKIATALVGPEARYTGEFSQKDINRLLSIAVIKGMQKQEVQDLQLIANIQRSQTTIADGRLRFSGAIQIQGIKGIRTTINLMTGYPDKEYIEYINTPNEPADARVHTLQLTNNPRLLISVADLDSARNLGQLAAIAGTDNPRDLLNKTAYNSLKNLNKVLFTVLKGELQPEDPSENAIFSRDIALDPKSMSLFITPRSTVKTSLSWV